MNTKPKKSLGQNFLRDPKILQKIADFGNIDGELVVEIGPGEGGLTEFLLKRAEKVIAVEKDEMLAEYLKNKFRQQIIDNRLEIIEGDILEIEPKNFLANYVLMGNIPYYITGEIFRKFLESEIPPKELVFVVQKEVAERIIAKDNKGSILSVSIKAYGIPEYGGTIKAGSFYPAPSVDSAILAVRGVNKERFGNIKEKDFFEIVRVGFAHKRKLLIRNLETVVSKKTLGEVFNKLGLDAQVRAEDLSIEQWFDIMNECQVRK